MEEAKKRKEKKRKGLRESLGEDIYICTVVLVRAGDGDGDGKGRDTGGWGLGARVGGRYVWVGIRGVDGLDGDDSWDESCGG